MRRKINLFIFSLVIIFTSLCFINVKAEEFSITMVDGAQIRTTGVQGLRFKCDATQDFEENVEHGFYLAIGVHSYEEMTSAINANSLVVGSDKLIKKSTNGTDKSFAVTVYDIEEAYYGQDITAIGYYVDNDVKHFSSICVSKNIIDIARIAYEEDDSLEFAGNIVANTKVKVTDTSYNVSYYSDLSSLSLKNGDVIELYKGTYSSFTIDKDNVSLYGYQHGVSASEARSDESIINGSISLSSGVKNTIIDGVKLNGSNVIVLNGANDSLNFENNICTFSGNDGIKDVNNSSIHKNLIIKNNAFISTNENYQKTINIIGSLNGASDISNNSFESALTSVNASDFVIKIDKMSDNSTLRIKSNEFNCYGANYIIDLCSDLGSNDNNIRVDIENNKMSVDSDTPLQGNGIRVGYLSSNAHINILHNYNFKTSTFYNAIMLSSTLSAASNEAKYPEVNIMYNEFYIDPLPGDSGNVIAKPAIREKTPSSAYIRIGFGLPVEGSGEDYHINITKNYFDGSTSRYAYEDIESTNYEKNNNQVALANGKYNDILTCDSEYSTYISDYVALENAIIYASSEKTIPDGYRQQIGYYNGKVSYNDETIDNLEHIILAINNAGVIGDMKDYYKSLLKQVAYDFYYQNNQIQYDQRNSRRNVDSKPEDATAYRGIYLDCSSYVNSIYKYVFGTNITNYSSQNTANFNSYSEAGGRSGDVIYYYVNSEVAEGDKAGIINDFMENIEVGDLVVYRHGDGGHVMIYVGDNSFLHCTGNSFTSITDGTTNPASVTNDGYTSAERNNGAIQLLAASEVFTNTSSKRYLFYTDQTSFSLIRPLMRNLTPTVEATNRAFLDSLTFEKTSSEAHMSTVCASDEITYTITIKNNNANSISGVNVTDVISNLCFYKSSTITNNGRVDGSSVSWTNLTIPASATINLSYTVKVKEGNTIGSIILSDNAKVNGVSMNKIYHTIGEYSDTDLSSLVTRAKTYIGNTTYTDDFKLFDDIYYAEFGKHLDSSIRTSQAAIQALIDLSNNTKYTNTALSEMIAVDLYGGIAIKSEMPTNNDRIRLVKDSYLDAGDIIVLYDKYSKTYKSYMYLGGTEDKIISIDNGTVSVVYTGSNLDTFLLQLFGYSRFAIIRPSLSMWNN